MATPDEIKERWTGLTPAERNAEIARMMGWHLCKERPTWGAKRLNKKGTLAGVQLSIIPDYTRDITAAMGVAGKMRELGYYVVIYMARRGFNGVTISRRAGAPLDGVHTTPLPQIICLAALIAVEASQ